MLRKIGIILFLLIVVQKISFGQSDITNKQLSLAEHVLLDFITTDSVNDLSLDIFKENLKFGVSNKLANGISLLKKKDKVYLQLLGSGRLYQIQKQGKGDYQFIRLDSTLYFGANFGSINFFYKDTLFKLGGGGFWKIIDYFTFYSTKTNEWELISSKKGIPVFQSPENGVSFFMDQLNGKFYLSNSINQTDFPASLNTTYSDTCRVFDFKDKTWQNLGKINPTLKDKLQKSLGLKTTFGPYLIFHSDLEIKWINFSTNQFGVLAKEKQAEFREKWLNLYKGLPEHLYQFVMGNQFYLIRIENNGAIAYESIELTSKDFIDPNAEPIYSNSAIVALLNKIEPGTPVIGNVFIVLMVILLYSLYNKKIKKNKTPIEIQSILYKNFFSALTAVEKELIQAIYALQIKQEQISIKAINKIIGVQQKDTITQNKSRSDYFLRINQKFKLATRANELLIVKQREETDKRVYNYNINPIFIDSMKALILNNQ
ncbi:MAG: hypothetical protein RLZZ424_460 [Bacteroidota bacterium]